MIDIKRNNLTAIKAMAKDSFVVLDKAVLGLHFEGEFEGAYIIEGGEGAKTFCNLKKLLCVLTQAKVNRDSRILAIGGGSVCDLAGLAAAVYMRGIEYSVVPTTLLAMADSAIGGKTAINFEGVKNLVGAFHHAKDCIISIDFLKTLDHQQLLSGLGEVVKTALLNQTLLNGVEERLSKLIEGDLDSLLFVVEQCVKIKSQITDGDFWDKGARKSLNLGHTMGHALEALTGLPHGLCVLRGLQIEADMFKSQIEPQFYQTIYSLTQAVLAASGVRFEIDKGQLLRLIALDKKNEGGSVGFVFAKNAQTVCLEQLELASVKSFLKI